MLDLDAEKQASKHASPSAEQLLASLPPETLARLVALAVGTAEQKVQRFTYGSFEALRDQRCHNGRHKLSLDYLERLYAVVELRADEFGWQRPTWTRESLALTLAEQDFPLLVPCTVGRALREIPLAEQSVWPRSEDPLPLNTQLHVGIPIAASQASRRPAPPSCRRSGAS